MFIHTYTLTELITDVEAEVTDEVRAEREVHDPAARRRAKELGGSK